MGIFNCGEECYQQSEGTDMNWIHIHDQLPETNTDVLFTCMYEDEGYCSDVQLGWYEGVKTLGDAIVMETSTDKHDWYPCTHWMPLPKTPEIPK